MGEYKKVCTYPIESCNECIHEHIDLPNGLLYCSEVLNILYKSDKKTEDEKMHDLIKKSSNMKIPEWCRLKDYKKEPYKNDFDKYLEENNPELLKLLHKGL